MVKKLVFGLKIWLLRKSTVGYYSSARDWSGTVHRLRQWLGHGSGTSTVAAREWLVSVRHRLGSLLGRGMHTARTRGTEIGRAQPRKWIATRWLSGHGREVPDRSREMPSRHIVEQVACIGCDRGFWSRLGSCRVLLDGVRGFLGQTFRRAPGVLDSRERVRRSRPDPGGSQIGYGSRLGLGLRWTWASGWAVLLGWIRFYFLF